MPVALLAEAKPKIHPRDRKPASLDRVIGPEWHVDVVGNHARIDLQQRGVAEDPGVRQRGRKGSSLNSAVTDQPPDLVVLHVGHQHVAVKWIASKSDDSGLAANALEGDDIGGHGIGLVAQSPDVTADKIAEDVAPVQVGKSQSPVDKSARDRGALVRTEPALVFLNRRQIIHESPPLVRPWPRDRPLMDRPTVVAAGFDDIDLLARALPLVSAIKQARRGIEGHPPRVAQSGRPKLRAHGRGIDGRPVDEVQPDKRIVRWDAVVAYRRRMNIWRTTAG